MHFRPSIWYIYIDINVVIHKCGAGEAVEFLNSFLPDEVKLDYYAWDFKKVSHKITYCFIFYDVMYDVFYVFMM